MNSSIFHSNGFTILALACATVFSGWFSFHQKCFSHVENIYFGEARSISFERAQKYSDAGTNRYIIFGGSTVRTSYIPSLMWNEFGIPFVNQGLHAGFGDRVISRLAFDDIKAGDVVVVALEPSFLCDLGPDSPNTGTTTGGRDFFLSQHGLDFSKDKFYTLNWTEAFSALQGNTRYKCFMLMKRLRHMKPYRYTDVDNLHEDGWMEVFERRPLSFSTKPLVFPPLMLGFHGKQMLTTIRNEAIARGASVIYAVPPSHSPWPETRIQIANLLRDILEILPVVKDPLLGINTNNSQFTDTTQHPDRNGAILATRSLGKALSENKFWTTDELTSFCLSAENPCEIREWNH